MINIYQKITEQFDFLLNLGLHFTYTESKGKLGDRLFQNFTYENLPLKRKFEIVYCTANIHPILYGSLIKYSPTNNNPEDPQSNIAFSRLRCFFTESSDIIFFGNEQYDFSYKLKEFTLIIKKFLDCVTSEKWIDYNEMLANERKIYVLSLEPKNNFLWADEIKSNKFIKKQLTIIYDCSTEPPYEAFGLRLKAKNGLVFHITHGHKSRDETGYNVQVIRPNIKTETHEFMNTDSNEVINFIRQSIST